MLMQNFKSAADLGITEPQLSALQKTLVLLETEKLRHWHGDPDFNAWKGFVRFQDRKYSGEFNMSSWSNGHRCGTACCIGGTAEMVGGLEIYSLDNTSEHNPALHRLFYPQTNISYSKITPAQAATALRSFLTTGDARWELAIAS